MRASLIVFAAALGLADAASNILSLNKRQGQAFNPGERTRPGANCVEAFGPGFIECRPASATESRLCINPDLGQTCCDRQWGCPAESFCLVKGFCCPDGLDPKTCAAQNSVTLPSDFSTSTTSALEGADTSTTSVSTPGGSFMTSSSSTESTTSTSLSATMTPTRGVGNGTTTRTGGPSGPVVTAGAYQERAGVAAVVLGLAAAVVL